MTGKRHTSPEEARRVGDEIGVDWRRYPLEEFRKGMGIEFEHGSHDPQTDMTHDDPIPTGKIALTHSPVHARAVRLRRHHLDRFAHVVERTKGRR